MLQYFIFSRYGRSDKARFCALSLYTDFCLRMLDNKFFDVLKDLIEEEVANHANSVEQLSLVIGLVRKVARCEKTDYSLKFIDLVQGVLGLLNKPVSEMGSDGQRRLLENCIGILTDMVENQVLQFFLTYSIVQRKFAKLGQDLQQLASAGKHSYGYAGLLGCVVWELDELVLDQRFFAFTSKPSEMNTEEKEAYDTCLEANNIVFGPLLQSGDVGSIARLAYYLLDQGLRAKIAREVHGMNAEDAAS